MFWLRFRRFCTSTSTPLTQRTSVSSEPCCRFAQITPRGSTMVFDDEHIALWERGRGTTTQNLTDGTPVTIFMRKPALREAGVLPKGGILRLYGRAKVHRSGPVYEEIWNRLIEAEKKGDPEKKGYGVLITIERAEDLSGQPLT